MHLYAQKYQICKISLHICNRDFINGIYIILGYNSDYTKKNMPSHKHPGSSYYKLFIINFD
jgi:hypothetical protein